ncbi:hypothetical protein [Thermococcus sp. JCM 11816]|uniref:hypothetical protein n=1 Tax=Thermococcus sp. (strain JCM 11816 / KS-1) TaxID=1295125 RepID=UPI0006CFC639
MTRAVLYFDVSQLSEFSKALQRIEELRIIVPVEVEKITTIEDDIAVILNVPPEDSIELVKNALPGAVVVA